jgi:type I restriction enzyme S subunit
MIDNSDFPEGSKSAELGALPEEWDIVRISDIVEFTKKPRSLSINPNQILPFIPMEMIPENNDSVPQWQEKRYSDISSGNFVFKGDLIVAKITPCFENGKQAILDNLPTDYAYTTTEIWPMHPKDNRLFIDFLANYLRDPPIRKELTAKMEGSTNRQRLPREALQNLLIPLPPLPEQHAIATTLRTVHEAKEKTDAVIAATKALKAAMMKHLFTYGPVPPEDAEQVALKETEIGQVPKGWDLQPLGKISKIASGGTPSRNEPTFWNGEIPWIRTGEINYSIIDRTEEKITKAGLENSSARIVPKGTLLMAMYGEGITRGRVGITGIDASINQAVAAIFPSKKMLTQFLYYYLEFSYEKNRLLGHGAHQRNLSATIIKTILVPIPAEETQQHIVEILSFIDQKLAAEQSRKEALDTLFASLLHDLMTAKIRIIND